jgi:hypothetical protein
VSVPMLTGVGVVLAGICVIAYGLMISAKGVREAGLVPIGARRVQFAGMALATCGFGVMMLSIGLIPTDIFGIVLVVQALAMLAFSPRLERFLR